MGNKKNILLMTLLLSISLCSVNLFSNDLQTIYEDGENENIDGWEIYDNDPSGAVVRNIYDDNKKSRVIEFVSHGTDNGFGLRNSEGSYWGNQTQLFLEWNMYFDENFIIYAYVQTSKGERYLRYLPGEFNSNISRTTISHSLGTVNNGEWHTVKRDLQKDLKSVEPDNAIIAVQTFLVRGRGRVDDIKLLSSEKIVQQMQEAEFIKRYYQYILKREADDGGLNYWLERLNENESVVSIAKKFIDSTEFQDQNLSHEAYIQVVYKTLLNRDADEDGLAYWIEELEHKGKSRDIIFYQFAYSDEFIALSNSYGLITESQRDNLESFVERLYTHVLGRKSDRVGLNYWSEQLKLNKKSTVQIARDFLYSEEFINKNFSEELFIQTLYISLMNRELNEEELNYWTREMENGLSKSDVIEGFLHSNEFDVLTLEYGLGEKEKPVSPADLSLKLIDNSAIELSWSDDSENESGYKIFRDGELIATTNANIVRYADSAIEPNRTYQYSVSAFNDQGDSETVIEKITTHDVSQGRKIYVAPNGNDSWSGLAESSSENDGPLSTIQKAADMAEPGDTIFLREGTYYGAVLLTKSGSKDDGYITFRNYPGEKPVISRNDANYYRNTFEGINVSYIKVIGLTFYQGIRNVLTFQKGSHHIEIRNNEIYEQNANVPENKRMGWSLSAVGYKDMEPTHHIIIDNNHVHHNHSGNPNVGGAYNEALTIAGNVQYFQVTNNHVYDNDFIGIDIIGHQAGQFSVFGMNKYGIVANNTVYGNGIESEWASSLYVDGAEYLIVENNTVYDNFGPGIAISQETKESTTDHVIVRHNVSWNNHYSMLGSPPSRGGYVRDSVFVHNLSNGSTGYQPEMYLGKGQGNRVKNNIFYAVEENIFREAGGSDLSSWVFDYNAYYPKPYEKDLHPLTVAEAYFMNYGAHDYRLSEDSPLIDAGVFLTVATQSGSGIEISVDDSRYFTNGWEVREGDMIQVGDNHIVKVVSVDYESHIITVDSEISWEEGDGVSYAYAGLKPDIGAFEFND